MEHLPSRDRRRGPRRSRADNVCEWDEGVGGGNSATGGGKNFNDSVVRPPGAVKVKRELRWAASATHPLSRQRPNQMKATAAYRAPGY